MIRVLLGVPGNKFKKPLPKCLAMLFTGLIGSETLEISKYVLSVGNVWSR